MVTARNDGDVDKAMSRAAKTIEAIYETPYLSHSPMEPMNATVHLQSDRLDVWVGSQDAEGALHAAALASGLKPEQVHIHNAFLGGGFGRRDGNDEIVQAIAIAQVVKRPVKLIWTREEDMRHDRFRPHAVVAFKAVTGSDGMPTAWSMRIVTSSIFKSVGICLPDGWGFEPARRRRPDQQRLCGFQHAHRVAPQEHPPAGLVLSRPRRQSARLRPRGFPRRDRLGEPARSLSPCGASFLAGKPDWI